MKNKATFILAIVSSLLTIFNCTTKNPTGPGNTETMGTTVSILKAAYTIPSPNNISITIPAHIKCSGSAPLTISDSSQSGSCRQAGSDSLYLALSVLMAGVSAIPTIDSATLATFSAVLSSIPGRQMDGVFLRVGTETGLPGSWAFAGVMLDPVIQAILDQNPPLKAQVDSTIGVLTGTAQDRILFLDFSTDSITVLNEKGWYGEQMVMGITDTTQYGMTITKPDVSHWQLQGKTTNDIVSITINSMGDLDYSSNNSGFAAYTYLLHPATCPNDQAPSWWSSFLTGNPHL